MPGLLLAIDAFSTRPFSICITTLTDCDEGSGFGFTSVFLFLDTEGTRIGFVAGSGGAARGGSVIGVTVEADATAGTSVLKPPVTAITVDKPTPIKTAATRNTDRCWTRVDRAGAGGRAKGSGRAATAATTGIASICNALSSQQPSSSETTRCNDGSIDRRELCISGLKLNAASGWAIATTIARRPGGSCIRACTH